MQRAAIALGSNLGDRHGHITWALKELGRLDGVRVAAVSDLIQTEPMGQPGQGAYINAAAMLETTLVPRELLECCLSIERERGRVRSPNLRWGPRTLDIDILLYGDALISEPGLEIPHPHMAERRFVLEPLAQIAGEWVHPRVGLTIESLLQRCSPPGGRNIEQTERVSP